MKSFILDTNIIIGKYNVLKKPLLEAHTKNQVELIVTEQLIIEILSAKRLTPENKRERLKFIFQLGQGRWYSLLERSLPLELSKTKNKKPYFLNCAIAKRNYVKPTNSRKEIATSLTEGLRDLRYSYKKEMHNNIQKLLNSDKTSLNFDEFFKEKVHELLPAQLHTLKEKNPKMELTEDYLKNPQKYPFNYYSAKFNIFTFWNALSEKPVSKQDDGSIIFDNDFLTILSKHDCLVTDEKKILPQAIDKVYESSKSCIDGETFLHYLLELQNQ